MSSCLATRDEDLDASQEQDEDLDASQTEMKILMIGKMPRPASRHFLIGVRIDEPFGGSSAFYITAVSVIRTALDKKGHQCSMDFV